MAWTYLQSDLGDVQTDDCKWSEVADYILDADGPLVRPYRRMGSGFASVPIVDRLRDIAEQYPDKLAVGDGVDRLNYSDLFSAVENLSRRIADSVADGEAVGILLASSIWYPVAMLASMAAGRPSVPFNIRDPGSRIVEIAVAARLSAVIGAGKARHARLPQEIRWIDVAAGVSATHSWTPAPPLSDVVPVDAPAIVLYTSGSTGRPKGIVNSQRSLLQRVQQYVDSCHINAEDVILPLTGPATIAGCREMFAALLTGATLHLVDVEAVGLRAVRSRMRTEGATITYVVPTLLRALMAEEAADTFNSLRVVRIGGEKVAWTDIALLRKVVSNTCLVQVGYSSTESTGSQWFVPRSLPEYGASVPAGWLLPGIAFTIVNDEGRPVEPGESGELLIKSPYVLLGHWEGGAVLPAQSDPDDPGVRIFATGDLVQLDHLGLLRIVGRKGRQLKINGRRVEPAELEHVLRCAPAVEDAVAIATAANELVAFVVPRHAAGPAGPDLAAELGQVVKEKLPRPLRPLRLHTIAEVPRLPGGKADVAKLREIDLLARKTAPNPQPANGGREPATYQLVRDAWTRSSQHQPNRGKLGRSRWRFAEVAALYHADRGCHRARAFARSLHRRHDSRRNGRCDRVSRDDWPHRASESRCASNPFSFAGIHRLWTEHGGLCDGDSRGRSGHPYQIPGSQKHPRRKEYGCQHGRRRRRADPAEPICRRYSPSRPFARWSGGIRSCSAAARSRAGSQISGYSGYIHRERAS